MKTKLIAIILLNIVSCLTLKASAQKPQDTSAKQSKAQAQKHTTNSADTITGFYSTKYGSTLAVKRLSGAKLKYQLQAFYPEANPSLKERPGGPNIGTAEGEAALKGNTAVITPPDFDNCRITVVFQGTTAKVTQKGCDTDCGFGANVDASGTYIKKSSHPKFQEL